MTYKGKYIPKNPQKYKGNPSQIIYRSLWERKFMVYCDRNDKVIEWGSEEVIVPYRSLGTVKYTDTFQTSISR